MSDQPSQTAADTGADTGAAPDSGRNSRRVIKGVVKSDKANRTITVSVERTFKHIKYKKYIRQHSTVYAHDEQEVANIGDTVELMECRPVSKSKRWRLTRVIATARIASGGAL